MTASQNVPNSRSGRISLGFKQLARCLHAALCVMAQRKMQQLRLCLPQGPPSE
jgi:hypothetical protein